MLKFLSTLGLSLGAYGQALPYLFKPGYRRYLVLPIVVYLGLLVGVIWLMYNNLNRWLSIVLSWFGYSFDELSTYSMLILIILQIVMFFFMSSLFKYATLIVLSPFLAFLSEKVEVEATGQEQPFLLEQMIKDLFRAVRLNLTNFLKEMGITFVLALLAFIPMVGILSPILIFVVQSYYLGYGLLDYNPERWRMDFPTTEKWMKERRGMVLGVGLGFHLLFLVPFLGWIFAPAWSVVAGTKVALKLR